MCPALTTAYLKNPKKKRPCRSMHKCQNVFVSKCVCVCRNVFVCVHALATMSVTYEEEDACVCVCPRPGDLATRPPHPLAHRIPLPASARLYRSRPPRTRRSRQRCASEEPSIRSFMRQPHIYGGKGNGREKPKPKQNLHTPKPNLKRQTQLC